MEEDVRVESVISDLIADELERADNTEDLKERQVAVNNVIKGVDQLISITKVQQDAYDKEESRKADKEKVDMQQYIDQQKIDLEKDRLEWERYKASKETELALEESKHRKRQFALDVTKIVVDIALTVTGVVVANNLMTKEAIINETGSIRNACGKTSTKMAENFMKKIERTPRR